MRPGRVIAAMTMVGLLAWQAAPVWAAAGDLDLSFGEQGTVLDRAMTGVAIAVTSDARIVVAGTVQPGTGPSRIGLMRLLADGRPDPAFSGDGIATMGYADPVQAADVALQSGRKIVVVGTRSTPMPTPENPYATRNVLAVARVRIDGSLDPTFSGDGKLTTGFANGAVAFGVAVQADGRIVVAGQLTDTWGQTTGRVALVRYRADGSLDPTFSADGKATAPMLTPGWGDIAIQPDGRIVLVGGDSSIDIRRFLTDGTVDRSFGSFGSFGIVSIEPWDVAPHGEYATAQSVAVQPDGKIVVGGLIDSEMCGWQVRQALLTRLTPAGHLDPGFGVRLFDRGGDCDAPPYEELGFPDIALRGDGKILAVGGYGAGYLVLFRTDGWLATGFGDGGVAELPPAMIDAIGVSVQPDGRIVVVSNTIDWESGTGVTRFLAA